MRAVIVLLGACGTSDPCALPPRDCEDGCAELVRFEPEKGPGYEDVPVEDEVTARYSTSYLRRDLMMLVKYATAKVACETGGRPLALGDMSDRDGNIPGTERRAPRHPDGTHQDGRDIDVAYYQSGTPDNHIRAICAHERDGVEQNHCVGPPVRLDPRRTALFIGALSESTHVRAIGVDGQVGGVLRDWIDALCASGEIARDACGRVHLVYEPADIGLGWFYSHHTHVHVSWKP